MSKRPADSSSIAGQIASHRQLDRLAWNLCTDLLLVVFSVISWCVATEARFYDAFDPSLSRELLFDDTAGNFWDILATGVYNVGGHSVSCGGFASVLMFAVCGLGIIQAVVWLIGFLPEYFRAKKCSVLLTKWLLPLRSLLRRRIRILIISMILSLLSAALMTRWSQMYTFPRATVT